MNAGQQIAGVAVYGYPRTTRRRPVKYTTRRRHCPACLTNQDTSTCPATCPERAEATR